MSVFIDTSALITLLDAEDARSAKAAETFKELLFSEELVTHSYVHVEAIAVVERRLGAAASDALINDVLPAIRTVWVDEHLHRRALASYRAGGHGVSFVDRVSFELMRDRGIDVAFAYDSDFAAAGFLSPATPDRSQQGQLSESPGGYDSAAGASDLVSVSEIAARASRPINTVQSWRRRRSDFPRPVAVLAAGPIWSWTVVARWIAGRPSRRIAEPTVPLFASGDSDLATRADEYFEGSTRRA